jgi:hypothetical protein
MRMPAGPYHGDEKNVAGRTTVASAVMEVPEARDGNPPASGTRLDVSVENRGKTI